MVKIKEDNILWLIGFSIFFGLSLMTFGFYLFYFNKILLIFPIIFGIFSFSKMNLYYKRVMYGKN